MEIARLTINKLPAHAKRYNTLPAWTDGIARWPETRLDVSVSTRFDFQGIPERALYKCYMGKVVIV